MSTVKVALRIRPRNPKEILDNISECIIYDPDINDKQVTLLPNRTFEFDYVFNVDSTQEMVYECVKPLLDKFLEGFNSTVFAYGQTSSGKTYTMGTGLDGNLNTEMQGIVPRSIYDLFQKLREKESDKFKYRVFVTFLELYNEDLTDLLHPESSSNYQIREDPWYGIKEEEVDSPEELLRYLQNGSLCRKTDTTQMNENSSRSHAIFTVTLKQEKWQEKDQNSSNENNKSDKMAEESEDKDENKVKDDTKKDELKGEWIKLSSKFRFVDLAGSERLKRTQAIGGQVKEGIKINQGLFALGKVIRALSEQRERHIPYRESKLTRLLKNSLGGNSQTLMLACVSCCEIDFNESLSTLRYAQSARKIKNKAIINTDWGHSAKDIALMKKKLGELQQTVNRLRDELAWYKGSNNVKGSRDQENENDDHMNKSFFSSSSYTVLQNELTELKNESENQKDELDELHFTISQLQDRIKDLTQQLSKAEAERDSMAIEFFKDKQQKTDKVSTDKDITEKDKYKKTESNKKNSENKENVNDNNGNESNLNTSINENHDVINNNNDNNNDNDDKNDNHDDNDKNDNDKNDNKNNKNNIINNENEDNKDNNNNNDNNDNNDSNDNNDNNNNDDVNHNNDTENDNDNDDDDDDDEPYVIKQNPIVVNYLKTIAELNEKCQKAEDQLKYYMAIHNDNKNKKIVRRRPFYEAAKATISSDKLQSASNTISDSKVDELIHRVKSELERQIKKENNQMKDNLSDEEPGTQEDELLVESIQDDIKVKEELLKTLIASQEKYNIMKENYEKKLKSLQNSIVHAQLERDEALKRIPNKNDNNRDNSSVHINNRYIERINRLKNEVSQLKKKYEEATLSISSAKNQNTSQIKTMKSNIESLKAEKAKMMKKIREERERANSKTLEIKKLKKKEYEASQLAKKLEQSNQLQQILLKRRKDEMKACQRKMKSMMDYLNRSNIPKTIAKSPRKKRPRYTLLKQSEKDKDEMLINNINIDINEDESRLKRKKQMLDHELDQCIIAQEIQHMIDEMEKKKTRLLDEQKELKNEREKIIRIESAKSKSFDPDQPQYMDDRLEMIDAEVQLINSRIKEAKKSNSLIDGANGDENGFTNAINIIKSTSFDNLQKLSEMLLSDIVEMKLKERHQIAQVASNERTIADLRVTLQVMKKTAVSAAIEYERKVKDLRHQQAYKQDQSNKVLSEYEDNYSDVMGGEMYDEEDGDGDISNILKKEKGIVDNDNDDNWLGKGEIYNKIYETGVIKGGRAEAVVNAVTLNQNLPEDIDISNNDGSLDYITTSYTPGLPSEIYQNINNYHNYDDSKEDQGEGEYLNVEDNHFPTTPFIKKLENDTIFLKPVSTGKIGNESFISPPENDINNTTNFNIKSSTLVNTSTPYQFSNAKEFDINTPLKDKSTKLSPIEFTPNDNDTSPLNNTYTINLSNNHQNINITDTNNDINTNTNIDTNININTNTNSNTKVNMDINTTSIINTNKNNINTNTNTNTNTDTNNNINTNTSTKTNTNTNVNTNTNTNTNINIINDPNTIVFNNKNNYHNLEDDIHHEKNYQSVTPVKNPFIPFTPNRVNSKKSTSPSSIPIASSKKIKKYEFKKPDEINKSKKLVSPPKEINKKKSSTLTPKMNKNTPKKDDKINHLNIEEKSPSKKSSFMSTLKNSTHFLAAFTSPFTPFTSPKKSPIKKPSFLFLQNLKIGSNNNNNNTVEDKETDINSKTKEETEQDKVDNNNNNNTINNDKKSLHGIKTSKRKNVHDKDEEVVSPPPLKRVKITEEDIIKDNTLSNNSDKENNFKNVLSSPNIKKQSNIESKIKESNEFGSLSEIVKSVHEESIQKLQNEMVSNKNNEKFFNSSFNQNNNNSSNKNNERIFNSSFNQDNDNSSNPSRLAYIHTQASQAKINSKTND
ncbi:kinesin-domain-containing protein [Anaeromyces robustus]|uniref:Kinesin-domain-containing protein n=1 Tax=Anaeromyces robustus TaxID=1754192 RepID=A0A1Y1VTU3_9FUNG|nr:kinesin-domain-containing protein [Anaeromyces robustus]|eukprot:ORX64435.1 kinesin-domain-containing protein [Anaeromyces robustus]